VIKRKERNRKKSADPLRRAGSLFGRQEQRQRRAHAKREPSSFHSVPGVIVRRYFRHWQKRSSF